MHSHPISLCCWSVDAAQTTETLTRTNVHASQCASIDAMHRTQQTALTEHNVQTTNQLRNERWRPSQASRGQTDRHSHVQPTTPNEQSNQPTNEPTNDRPTDPLDVGCDEKRSSQRNGKKKKKNNNNNNINLWPSEGAIN